MEILQFITLGNRGKTKLCCISPKYFHFIFICSLDVEGSEFPILKTIPFDKVDIKVLDVEVNHAGSIFPGSFKDIDDYLKLQGYDLYSILSSQDAIYVKRGFIDEIHEL